MWSLIELVLGRICDSHFGRWARDVKLCWGLFVMIPGGVFLAFTFSPLVDGLLGLFPFVFHEAKRVDTNPVLILYIGAGLGGLVHVFRLWRDGITILPGKDDNQETGQ